MRRNNRLQRASMSWPEVSEPHCVQYACDIGPFTARSNTEWSNDQHKTRQSVSWGCALLCHLVCTSPSQSPSRHKIYRDDELRQYAGDRLSRRAAVGPRGVYNAEQLCDVDVDVCVRAGELRRHREFEALLCEQSVGTGGPDTSGDQAAARRGSERR